MPWLGAHPRLSRLECGRLEPLNDLGALEWCACELDSWLAFRLERLRHLGKQVNELYKDEHALVLGDLLHQPHDGRELDSIRDGRRATVPACTGSWGHPQPTPPQRTPPSANATATNTTLSQRHRSQRHLQPTRLRAKAHHPRGGSMCEAAARAGCNKCGGDENALALFAELGDGDHARRARGGLAIRCFMANLIGRAAAD